MITRFKVSGFKNLVDVDVHLGPVTCIAGANGVAKSNLFDAIRFLSLCASGSLAEGAVSIRRGEGSTRFVDPSSIFAKAPNGEARVLSFEVDMVVPAHVEDDLGQVAEATSTFLRYSLELVWEAPRIRIRSESLDYIPAGKARADLLFPHNARWRESVVASSRRGAPFISTSGDTIRLHQDQAGSGKSRAGRPRPHDANRLPRTVLSTANAAESKTVMAAKREMEAWQLLQLEPSSMREPDLYGDPRRMGADGSHMPATLSRLLEWRPNDHLEADRQWTADDVCSRISNQLAWLIDGVRSVRLDRDDRRELLTILLTDTLGNEFEARSLSDGTLRFLALSLLEQDPEATGVLCLEEPENGIHPARIPAMVRLLRDLAVDVEFEVDETNPLRQIVFNTHSPRVFGFCDHNDVLVALPGMGPAREVLSPSFRWLSGTWRAERFPQHETVSPGYVLEYLRLGTGSETPDESEAVRVVDREDLQMWLPAQSGCLPAST